MRRLILLIVFISRYCYGQDINLHYLLALTYGDEVNIKKILIDLNKFEFKGTETNGDWKTYKYDKYRDYVDISRNITVNSKIPQIEVTYFFKASEKFDNLLELLKSGRFTNINEGFNQEGIYYQTWEFMDQYFVIYKISEDSYIIKAYSLYFTSSPSSH